jgi:hypothetical protein
MLTLSHDELASSATTLTMWLNPVSVLIGVHALTARRPPRRGQYEDEIRKGLLSPSREKGQRDELHSCSMVSNKLSHDQSERNIPCGWLERTTTGRRYTDALEKLDNRTTGIGVVPSANELQKTWMWRRGGRRTSSKNAEMLLCS